RLVVRRQRVAARVEPAQPLLRQRVRHQVEDPVGAGDMGLRLGGKVRHQRDSRAHDAQSALAHCGFTSADH
ncbi:MAG: hypothetical protein HGA19_10150, partial [Oscillochloris sp.]|nr:hypothetical protein [Oscillochloris sp.]